MSETSERHEFQTEVRQLLDLMIHSLYSHKEVFLRELLSGRKPKLADLSNGSQCGPPIGVQS